MDLLAALKLFVRAVERRNFAAAARDLGVSQATVTRAVQTLERHYGVELVRRSTREMVATEAGLRLHRGGAELLSASAALRQEVGEGRDAPPAGPLRITAPSAFGVAAVAPVAARFSSRHPAVTLDLRLTDRYLDLVAENIDLAIRIGAMRDSGLIQRKLADLTEVLVAAPGYLETAPPLDAPADLEAQRYVALSALQDGRQGFLLAGPGEQSVSVRPRGGLSFDTPLGVREALLAGAGVGRIHLYLVAGDLAAGRLAPVLPGWRCPSWPMTLVTTARARSRAADLFIQDLAEALAGTPGVQPA